MGSLNRDTETLELAIRNGAPPEKLIKQLHALLAKTREETRSMCAHIASDAGEGGWDDTTYAIVDAIRAHEFE